MKTETKNNKKNNTKGIIKKAVKIVCVIVVILIAVILLDTLQALLFDNSPLLRIREKDNLYTVDKGILVKTYTYCDGSKTTISNFIPRDLSIPICHNNNNNDKNETTENTELSCLKNLLGGCIVTENTNLVEESLSSIIDVDDDIEDAILMRGKSDTDPELDTGISVIIKTEDNEIISQLNDYFNKNYAGYKSFVSGDYNIYLYNKVLNNESYNNLETEAAKCLTK